MVYRMQFSILTTKTESGFQRTFRDRTPAWHWDTNGEPHNLDSVLVPNRSDIRVRSVKPVGRFGEGRRESRCTRSLLESRTTREVVTSPRAIVDAGVYQPLCSGILCEPDK
jgi:hypothetical protein